MSRVSLFIVTFLLVLSLASCRVEPSKVQNKNVLCDSVFYTIKNSKTIFSIDSILNNEAIRFCDFRFSQFHDTLTITFNLSEVSTTEDEQNHLKTNRFLIIKDKKIKVISSEDVMLTTEVISSSVHHDPHYISVQLTIPDYVIIDVGSWPPI